MKAKGQTMIVATSIIAGKPTSNLNIYPRAILKEVVKRFNNRAHKVPIIGGELNPFRIDAIDEPSFRTRRLFLNESDMLCAEIEIDDSEAGRALLEKINTSERVIARPVMVVPAYVDIQKKTKSKTDLLEVVKIHSIIRVQVECDGKFTGSD